MSPLASLNDEPKCQDGWEYHAKTLLENPMENNGTPVRISDHLPGAAEHCILCWEDPRCKAAMCSVVNPPLAALNLCGIFMYFHYFFRNGCLVMFGIVWLSNIFRRGTKNQYKSSSSLGATVDSTTVDGRRYPGLLTPHVRVALRS